MTENPFFNASFMTLSGQMAQAWQKSLEAWWQSLLGDKDRLADLARVLAEAGLGSTERAETTAADLARVVEALELLERRHSALEEQVRSLTENLGAVVTFLERFQGTTSAGTEGRAAEGGGEGGDER